MKAIPKCLSASRGFSYVDLIEDSRTHKDYALKRITCHSKDEEKTANREVDLMRSFKHPNIIPLEEVATVKINKYSKTVDIISEVLIVMPYYSVSIKVKVKQKSLCKLWILSVNFFVPRTLAKARDIKTHLSICPSLCPSVCLSQKL